MAKKIRKTHTRSDEPASAEAEKRATLALPALTIGIGASSGRLVPLRTLLSGLPTGRGLAVVVVQHSRPDAEGLLVSLISEQTRLKVLEAADGLVIAADHIYVMPPDKSLSVVNGRLTVQDVSPCRGPRMPIDHLFCTLATDLGRRAAGIILSGTGMDGTHGLADIKALGGITAAQEPATAEFPEMPENAATTGHADVVLAPEKLAAFLVERADELTALTIPQQEQAGLEEVLVAVRNFTGHDFHCYKPSTLERRIRRRMALQRCDTYDDYARLLRTNRDEASAMRKDLLIGVTEFFRQMEAWRRLEEKVIRELIANAEPESTLRVWVPGCASGKEAYSLAILLAETVEESGKKLSLKIFATDADATAVEQARSGRYMEEELEGISQDRLVRFFVQKNARYEVVKQLRDLIVFAPQDLTTDPPFSKLDLISCRNLLIYIDHSIQKKIIQLFHFALREGGYLFLGSAENICGQESLFEPVSQKWRIYRKVGVAASVGMELPLHSAAKPVLSIPAASGSWATLPGIAHQALAERFGPPAVIVDRKGTLLFLHGELDDYLHMPPGEQTGLLSDAAREGLRNRLASAMLQAVSENKKVSVQGRVKKGRRSISVKVTLSPLRHLREAEGLLLVTFEPQRIAGAVQAAVEGEMTPSGLRQVEDELRVTREELSSTIKQLEQSNEHLKASNEEVMAANEELQSANEELETSKEELHSLNEELNAANQQLQEKVLELEQARDDVANLLTSGNIATIFLDRKLSVRRFTPAATKLLNLIATDIGRPITDIVPKFRDEALIEDANRVLTELTPATAEVQTEDGTWYNRRILPYRTQDDGSEGVVITFADITELKQLTEAIRESRAKLQAAFASMTEAIFVADAEGRLIDFNDEFVRYHRFRDREECSRTIADCPKYLDVWFPNGTPAPLEQWAMPRALRGETASNVEYRLRRKETGETWWGSYNFAPIKDQNGRISDAVVAASEITERKAAEEALRLSEEKFARAFAENPTAVGMTRLEDGVFVDVNDTFLAMTGWSREEAVGHSAREMHIWPTAEAARRFVDELKGKGSLRGWEQEFYKKSGETFVGQLWATVLTVRGEKVILSTVVDITERKQAEKALRQSREDLDRAQAVGQIGSWRLDIRRNVLIWSDETHRIFGIPKGTPLTYEAFLATIHPDDRNYVDIRWNAGLRGEPYDIEHRIVADGKVRWVREKAYLEFDDAGQLLGGFGIAQDITERKQAKEALQQLNAELEQRILERTAELVKAGERIKSERQRLFDVLETLPAMICLLTPDYHVAFANRGFRERFGKSNGRHCYEYCFGLSQPCEFCETYKVLETGQPHRWEVNSPDGSVIAAYDFPFTDVDGSPMILEMDIDITEQRRTEEALRHAGDYNRSLIEASLDPLVTIGPDGRITDVNAAAEQITGFGRKELVGTDFSEYFTEPERAQAGYRQVFREGVVRDYPLEIRHRNGQTTPVLYNTSVYRDADGKGIGVFAAARDVTERKRAETALRELNETLERRVAERTEELARSNEDLQQFAYVASHDLQEPLRMVNGFLQLLEERYKQQLDDKAREYIRYSAEGATRMSNLIHDLLEYSRVERKEGGHKPVDASLALSGAMANLRSAIEQANATMTYEQLPAVMGDPTHLMQLFQNLIGNAIKFCSPERPCQIHVGAQHRDGWWVFYVRDNGIGIPKEAFDRIFVIFQRLHMREKYTGTGIGLSICKKIAEQHGGRIWVESEPGQGATFYFSLREA